MEDQEKEDKVQDANYFTERMVYIIQGLTNDMESAYLSKALPLADEAIKKDYFREASYLIAAISHTLNNAVVFSDRQEDQEVPA